MFSSIKKALRKVRRVQQQMVSATETYLILRKYHSPSVDDLTGDPEITSGNSFTDYKIPCAIQESEDYKSRRDREWTGASYKGLRLIITPTNIVPSEEDIIFVDFAGGVNPYKIILIKTVNGRCQIDIERTDRAID